MVRTVSYSHTNSYEIVNELTDATKNIWLCFHGLGYLATYFKRYFQTLDAKENNIILPQAPSKFYQGKDFKHVGASWLTRVDTQQEMQNNLNYIHAVLEAEKVKGDQRLILFGYSQGVSIATRFLKNYSDSIKAIVLHSGAVPKELTKQDGDHFKSLCNSFYYIMGTKDEYATPERRKEEIPRLKMLFGTDCEMLEPEIKHEVHVPSLENIATQLSS